MPFSVPVESCALWIIPLSSQEGNTLYHLAMWEEVAVGRGHAEVIYIVWDEGAREEGVCTGRGMARISL